MDRDTDLIPSSSTNSSPSSSDLDTESTGSFFPHRSTTLGTLMGVNFPSSDVRVRSSAVRIPSTRERSNGSAVKKAVERRRRSWWRLCRDDMVRPTSLGHFLKVRRRTSSPSLDAGDVVAVGPFFVEEEEEKHVSVGGGRLFENGSVLPRPSGEAAVAAVAERRRRRRERVPVLLAGICIGGDGELDGCQL